MSNIYPARADQVGSLLRPTQLEQARADCAAQKISANALRDIEDHYIREAVEKQTAIGLTAVTERHGLPISISYV